MIMRGPNVNVVHSMIRRSRVSCHIWRLCECTVLLVLYFFQRQRPLRCGIDASSRSGRSLAEISELLMKGFADYAHHAATASNVNTVSNRTYYHALGDH